MKNNTLSKIMRQATAYILSLIIILCSAATAIAGGKGDGGCTIAPKVPAYAASTSDKAYGHFEEIGECFVGITTRGIFKPEFIFEEENGRVHIAGFTNKEESGMYITAWVNSADIARFTYECGCGSSKESRENCTPFSGIFSFVYNTCYKEARDKKRAEILKQGVAASVVAPVAESSVNTKNDEKALRNEDIISLAKVGLDDNLIITKIKTAKSVDFDISTTGLVALKAAKISNAVIDTMMKRVEK
ncbi:MAG: hypothetical protein WCO53_00470 [Deltaproteobacteria bacterium]